MTAKEMAMEAFRCAQVVWASETDGKLDPKRLRELQLKYVELALQKRKHDDCICYAPYCGHCAETNK